MRFKHTVTGQVATFICITRGWCDVGGEFVKLRTGNSDFFVTRTSFEKEWNPI